MMSGIFSPSNTSLSINNFSINAKIGDYVLSLSSESRLETSSILIVSVDIVIPCFVSTSWILKLTATNCLSLFDTSLSINNVWINTKIRYWVLNETLRISLSSECRFKASSILIVSVDVVIPSFVSTSWSFQFMASH